MVGMPQATSTFSIARRISPRASSSVLPFSMVMRAGQLLEVLLEQRLELEQVLDAGRGRDAPPAGEGRRADWAALSTSSAGESGTRASTSPVAGFVTGRLSLAGDGHQLPA